MARRLIRLRGLRPQPCGGAEEQGSVGAGEKRGTWSSTFNELIALALAQRNGELVVPLDPCSVLPYN
jgi:hypothetical protein